MSPDLLPTCLSTHYSNTMSENRSIRKNQCSDLIKRIRRDARRINEEETSRKYQPGHETLRKCEGGSIIAPTDQDLVYLSKNLFRLICQWIV